MTDGPASCPCCGYEKLQDVAENRLVAYGADPVLMMVHVPQKRCPSCGLAFSYNATETAITGAVQRYRNAFTKLN